MDMAEVAGVNASSLSAAFIDVSPVGISIRSGPVGLVRTGVW